MRRQRGIGIVVVLLVCGAFAAGTRADVGSLADSNGEVVGWGDNTWGQLNVPAGTYTDIAAGYRHSLGIKTDGTLAAWGQNMSGETVVPAGTFSKIAAGGFFSLGIKTDGTLAAWGDNTYGQLSNLPSGTFSDVAGGYRHSVGLRADGTLVDWGDSSQHQLDNSPTGTFQAIEAGGYHSLGIRTDGTLAGWGSNSAGQATVPTGAFADVAGGFVHSLGLRTDGTLAGWGDNRVGQLDNVPTGAFTGVAAGSFHSVALRTDGTLAGWGVDRLVDPFPAPPEGKFVAVAAGGDHALALRARTAYDDLVVNGNGVTDPASWLNRDITVAGDATIRSTLYTTGRPTMNVNGQITLESGGRIEGTDHGFATLQGKFLGQAGSSINATDDSLILGTDASAEGFVHNGTINMSSTGHIYLHDADTAVLSGHTSLGDGGVLGSSHGIMLTSTGSIVGDGGAALQDGLTNHGVVTGGANGGLWMVDGLVNGEGSFLGDVWFLRTTYSPGNSPASVTLGDPTFSGGRLEMELGGLIQGAEYDHLNILGTATLYGPTLDVDLINGFTPRSGYYFDLFDGNLSGTFRTLNLPTLTSGLYWDWSTLYADGILRVEGTAQVVPVPGAVLLVLLGLGTVGGLRRLRA